MGRVAEHHAEQHHLEPACRACDGAGSVTTTGMTFSMSEEQWYPVEEEEPCPWCGGDP